MRVHFNAIITVDKRLTVRLVTHALCDPPVDYSSYKAKLVGGVKQVLLNAGDPARQHPYRPLAAISRGYDSTATAFMAQQSGCTRAVTYIDPRGKNPHFDSGLDNAARLGMACPEYDRTAYLRRSDLAEAEFCFYTSGIKVPMVVMESELAGSILVTGEFGGIVWDKVNCALNEQLALPYIRDNHGSDPIEFRLRIGCLFFAPAMIGARHNKEIHRITTSDAMRPWSIQGEYDRPIPRRILEESGLPRASFGINKFATAHIALNNTKDFSGASLNHYNTFVKQLAESDEKKSYLFWKTVTANRHSGYKGLDILSKLAGNKHGARVVKSSPLQRQFPFVLNARPLPVPWPFGYTFQWAFSLLKDRYKLPDRGKHTGQNKQLLCSPP